MIALLSLLVAVPVALAASSSGSNYDFALTGAQGEAGLWKNAAQLVSITATPSVDATVTAHFSSDNGTSWTTKSAVDTHTATFSFPVADEGSNRIVYYASDTSSTVLPESPHSGIFVNIDKTKPTFTTVTGLETTSTQSSAAGWSQDTTGTVTFVATDTAPAGVNASSGVKEISRRINGGTAVTSTTASVSFAWVKGSGGVVEGSNAVVYSALDWAGNLQTLTGYLNIDTVAPTTTASPAFASSATTGWRNTPQQVTLTATDVSSGVAADGTTHIIDSGSPQHDTTFTVGTATSNTSFSVRYFSTDRAGNVETTQTGYVNIDTSAPTVVATTAPSRASGWYNKDVLVTLTGVDAPSGIEKTQYRAEGTAAWTDAVSNQFTVPASDNAVETFDYQAVDKAGNVSTAASLALKMDSKKPRTYGQSVLGKAGKSIKVKYKIKDNLSPKAKSVYVKIKNFRGKVVKTQKFSAEKTVNKWYSFKWKTKTKGTYKYYVYAKDLAGNSQNHAGWAKIKVR